MVDLFAVQVEVQRHFFVLNLDFGGETSEIVKIKEKQKKEHLNLKGWFGIFHIKPCF